VIYVILLRGEDYIELRAEYYDRKNKPRVVSRLLSRLSILGYLDALPCMVAVGYQRSKL
jgi:hypothetical protein